MATNSLGGAFGGGDAPVSTEEQAQGLTTTNDSSLGGEFASAFTTPTGGGAVGPTGPAGRGIRSITANPESPMPGQNTTLTITYTDGTTQTFTITTGAQGSEGPQGPMGLPGNDGRGIDDIAGVVQTDGNTLVTVSYSDNTSDTYIVQRGEQGDQGVSVMSVVGSAPVVGTNTTVTVTLTDGTTQTFDVPPGTTGGTGNDGVGVMSVVGVDDANNNTIVTVTLTDGTTQTFRVNRGQPGARGVEGPVGPQGPGITNVVDNGDGTLTISYGATGSVTTSDLTGPPGMDGGPGPDGPPGMAGRGIQSVTAPLNPPVGMSSTATVTFTDGTTSDINLPAGPMGQRGNDGDRGAQGDPGMDGATGNGIASVTVPATTTLGTSYTATINFTDGTTQDFTVPAGVQGVQGIPGTDGATGPRGRSIQNVTDQVITAQELTRLTINYDDGTSDLIDVPFLMGGGTGMAALSAQLNEFQDHLSIDEDELYLRETSVESLVFAKGSTTPDATTDSDDLATLTDVIDAARSQVLELGEWQGYTPLTRTVVTIDGMPYNNVPPGDAASNFQHYEYAVGGDRLWRAVNGIIRGVDLRWDRSQGMFVTTSTPPPVGTYAVHLRAGLRDDQIRGADTIFILQNAAGIQDQLPLAGRIGGLALPGLGYAADADADAAATNDTFYEGVNLYQLGDTLEQYLESGILEDYIEGLIDDNRPVQHPGFQPGVMTLSSNGYTIGDTVPTTLTATVSLTQASIDDGWTFTAVSGVFNGATVTGVLNAAATTQTFTFTNVPTVAGNYTVSADLEGSHATLSTAARERTAQFTVRTPQALSYWVVDTADYDATDTVQVADILALNEMEQNITELPHVFSFTPAELAGGGRILIALPDSLSPTTLQVGTGGFFSDVITNTDIRTINDSANNGLPYRVFQLRIGGAGVNPDVNVAVRID